MQEEFDGFISYNEGIHHGKGLEDERPDLINNEEDWDV